MRMPRSSQATWGGTVSDGSGTMTIGQGQITVPFSLKSRLGGESATNPEELIGAAHAGCFAMSLANLLEERGTPAVTISAHATVHLVAQSNGYAIPQVDLVCEGVVPDIDEDAFRRLAEQAKATCPISKLLTAQITLAARLVNPRELG